MKQGYVKRLDALEARTGEKVCGLLYTNPQAYHDPIARAGLVRISGSDVAMTEEEFAYRYPHGTIICITYTHDWRGAGHYGE